MCLNLLTAQMKNRLQASRLLFIHLTADCDGDSEELPIKVYEERYNTFNQMNFKVEADSAEGVAMGHIEKMKAADDGEPPRQFVAKLS